LDRETGNIVRTTGFTSTSEASVGGVTSNGAEPTHRNPEDMAAMVWNFVKASEGLVTGLDAEDDMKLLRLRTRKHELVIVPDSKFLLIVVHDTPLA